MSEGSPAPGVLSVVAAGPGLGMAVARRFAREGFAVGLVGRTATTLEPLATELRDLGVTAATVTADVGDVAALRAGLGVLRAELGDPAVLVFNGSAWVEGRPTEVAPEVLLDAVRVGVVGALVSAQEVAPAMREAGRGTIVLTGSVAADRPSVSAVSVGVAKAAMRALARGLHRELAPDGVYATTVTIDGVLSGPKALDLGALADRYWALHLAGADEWVAESRYPG